MTEQRENHAEQPDDDDRPDDGPDDGPDDEEGYVLVEDNVEGGDSREALEDQGTLEDESDDWADWEERQVREAQQELWTRARSYYTQHGLAAFGGYVRNLDENDRWHVLQNQELMELYEDAQWLQEQRRWLTAMGRELFIAYIDEPTLSEREGRTLRADREIACALGWTG